MPNDVVYGLRAGLAVFEKRRDDVLRVHHVRDAHRDARTAIAWARSKGIAHEANERELEKIAGARNHEGLVLETKPRKFVSPNDLAEALLRSKGVAIALDRVRNPYNVGAILRTAAFFGVEAAILGAPAPHPALAADAVRVAEGGAEHLLLSRTTDLAETITRVRARGVHVFGADGEGKEDARRFAFARPAILVMGNEREGMTDRVRAQCEAIVAIHGSKAIESLNVAVAAGVLIAELTR